MMDDFYKFTINEKGEMVEASPDAVKTYQTALGEMWMPVTFTFKVVELTASEVCAAYNAPISVADQVGAEQFLFVERAIFSIIDQTIPFTDGGAFGLFFNGKEILATQLGEAENIRNSTATQLKSVTANSDQIRGSSLYFSNLSGPFSGGDGKLRIEFFYREIS